MASLAQNPDAPTPGALRSAIASAYRQLNSKQPVETIKVGMGVPAGKVFTSKDIAMLREDGRALLQNCTAEEIINQTDNYNNGYFVLKVDGSKSRNLSTAKRITETNWSGGTVDIAAVKVYIARIVYASVHIKSGKLGTDWKVYYKGSLINASKIDLEPGKTLWFISELPYASGVSRFVKETGGRMTKAARKRRAASPALKSRGDSLIVKVRKQLEKAQFLKAFRVRAAEMRWTYGNPPSRKRGTARKIAIRITFYPQRLGS